MLIQSVELEDTVQLTNMKDMVILLTLIITGIFYFTVLFTNLWKRKNPVKSDLHWNEGEDNKLPSWWTEDILEGVGYYKISLLPSGNYFCRFVVFQNGQKWKIMDAYKFYNNIPEREVYNAYCDRNIIGEFETLQAAMDACQSANKDCKHPIKLENLFN